MAQRVIEATDLPEAALDAAAQFMARHVPMARRILGDAEGIDALAVVFPLGDKDQRGWRLAAIQSLAREAAPSRVNGVVGEEDKATRETVEYLASAPGITGQLLEVDGNHAEMD